MHLSAAISRLRAALAAAASPLSYPRENDPQVASGKRSKPRMISRPRTFSVSRTEYENDAAPVLISVPPKRRKADKIQLEDRRELARILDRPLKQIPPRGLKIQPEDLADVIKVAEAAARATKRAKKKTAAKARA